MGGWISAGLLFCAAAVLCGRLLSVRRRIRALTLQVEAFSAGKSAPGEVALEEDSLAGLQNGIGDLEQQCTRLRQLHQEECRRTSSLTADISHQLKTPLATLRLYTEMDEAPHREACLEQIQRMENLIGALLRLERLCADGYAFHFVQADAAALIREQWSLLQVVYPEKQLLLTGDACIRCDPRWLGEAFLNLLKNACEHTPPAGEIFLRLERQDTLFFCTLEDTGGGVAEEALPRLWQRFYRAPGSTGTGAGIGLAIVKEIILRHHGTIRAENGERGLKISVTLPMLDISLTNP